MAQIIGLPKLSPTMEEGVLVRWVKKEGDAVEPGELVAEVETDKANMDFNLEDEGVLLKQLVPEGATVKLGAPVAILGDKGEDITELVARAEALLAGGGATEAKAEPEPQAAPKAEPKPQEKAQAEPKPEAKAQAEPKPEAKAQAVAKPQAAPKARPAVPAAPAADAGGRVLASPLAKNLAIELGIDLRTVQGTGPGGRIVERDVRAAAAGGGAAPASAPAQAQPAPSSTALAVVGPSQAPVPIAAEGDYEDVPLSGVRKTIARRLLEATQSIPHFYLTRSFRADALLAFRKRLNDLLGDRGKVSVNDLILKGVALALRRVPQCNAAFLGDAIRYHSRVHLGVAVAIEEGLVTPVVRDADLKGIGVIASEVRDLAARARERRLKVHEIQGSTFTVSNLGMFGIDQFSAIINPPEAGILAVGAASEHPVVRDGVLTMQQRVNLVLSCDHRVIDGALGARFLAALADLLEQPESLAL